MFGSQRISQPGCSDFGSGGTDRRRLMLAASGAFLAGIYPSTLRAQPSKPAQPSSAKPADGPGVLRPLMAVNLSGRQRTLAIRAGRCYAQLGMSIVPQRSADAMRIATSDFESTLAALRVFCAGKPSAGLLDVQAGLWAPFKASLREVPSPELARPLSDMLERLIPACTAVHDQVVKEVGTPVATVVSRSGRQRFLSQRASQLFMFREWGVTSGDFKDIEALATESQQLRKSLRDTVEVASDARRDLDLAETQWIFFDEALRAQVKGRVDDVSRRNVATTSERLMEIFEKMTLTIVSVNE